MSTNKQSATVLMVAGGFSLLGGILVIVYPDVTLLALAIITGINLFIFGVLGIFEGITGGNDDSGARTLNLVLGLIAVIGGVVLIRRPGETLVAIVLVLGLWFVLSALVAFVRVIVQPGARAVRALAALAEFVLGILILSLPDVSLKTVAVLAGIAFAVRGVALISAGRELRKEPERAAGPAAMPA